MLFFKRIRSLMITALIFMVVVLLSAPLAYGFQPMGVETAALSEIKDSRLEETRGRYMGFYFSVEFTGFWNTMGDMAANINVNGGVDSTAGSGNITFTGDSSNNGAPATGGDIIASGENYEVKSVAVVDGYSGGKGVFQVNQVPGSMNVVHNGLVINLTIINVLESQVSKVPNLGDLLSLPN